MESLFPLFCLVVSLMLWLWGLSSWESSFRQVESEFINDYREETCARLWAIDKNLELSLIFLKPWSQSEEQWTSWNLARREVQNRLMETYDQLSWDDCQAMVGKRFELDEQKHPGLSPLYPNIWIRWLPRMES